jgi:hypothetical protein
MLAKMAIRVESEFNFPLPAPSGRAPVFEPDPGVSLAALAHPWLLSVTPSALFCRPLKRAHKLVWNADPSTKVLG